MRHSDQCGFTLIELIMVLVLIGLVSAIGSSLWFDRETFEERGFYDETLASFRYAQKLAIATCSPVRVNVAATGYSLFQAAAAGGCANLCTLAGTPNAVTDPSNSVNFTRNAPTGIALAPVGNIIFCRDGSANTTTTVTVGTRQFQVWAVTGLVERQ